MLLSSNDPTPINDLPNNTDITDKFRRKQNVPMYIPFPSMTDFCNRPNLKTAKALLRGYNIPCPLATNVVRYKKEKNIKPDEQKGSAPMHPMQPFPSNKLFHELLLLDTLHDLQNVNNKKQIYNIFKKELCKTNIPRQLQLSYLSSKKSFTRDAVDYLRKQYPVSMITSDMHIHLNRQNDAKLQRRLETITELNFVLDNIIAGIYEDADITDGTIGILGCAFILVLLTNMKTLKIIKSSVNKQNRHHQINLHDGLFMSIDGVYMKRFMILFLKAAKRLSGVDDVFLHVNVRNFWIADILKPKYFNMCFPNNQVEIIEHNQTADIKIGTNIYNIVDYNNNINTPTSNTNITYPHTKEDFAKYILANNINTNDNYKDLWYLNFLRDAFKADVAVEKNYIYMTHDRLAHLYYKFIGGTIGFLLAIDKEPDQDEINYTVLF